MASKRMLPDAVTLYHFLYEEGGVAQYAKTVVEHVKCVVVKGSNASGQSGNAEGNQATLWMFDVGSTVHGDLAIADDGKDYFVVGKCGSDTPKGIPARFRISAAERLKQGSRRMWHWKVVGT